MRRRKGKHGSAVWSCNGKLQIIPDEMRLRSRDDNWRCRVWRQGEMEGTECQGRGGWRLRPLSSCVASQGKVLGPNMLAHRTDEMRFLYFINKCLLHR